MISHQVKQKMWQLLISKGGALDREGRKKDKEASGSWSDPNLLSPVSYYGNCILASYKHSERLLQDIEKASVDWVKTSELSTDRWQIFSGTFEENNQYASYLIGTIVFDNGNAYEVATLIEGGMGFGYALQLMASVSEINMKDAIEELRKRLNEFKDSIYGKSMSSSDMENMFRYTCTLQ